MDPRSKVNFDVEGKTYTLHYTTNAFVEFEDETGQSVLDVLGREDISLKTIRALVWAGLVENHEGITPRDAGRIIDAAGGLEPIMDLINGAIAASLPQEGGDEEPGKKPKAA
jgi:hypothetical protein